ncbi:MAG: hypothetical protein L0241_08520 [Planctomycetia bacterium]|nr:hypothetical protein [Planctomycetia bacterium]
MTEPLAPPTANRLYSWRGVGLVGLCASLLAFIHFATEPTTSSAADTPGSKAKEPTIGGFPLFNQWPKQNPDAVLVLTGQTFGFLQPCGCSRPQVGGLERRGMFIESLKAKGWPVAAIDLGDIYPEKPANRDQGMMRYVTTLHAMREMGYVAVGMGKTEIEGDILRLLSGYALQKQQRPFTLAGNAQAVVDGKVFKREDYFPGPGKRSSVELIEVAKIGKIPVGVAGVVGKSLADAVKTKKLDPAGALDFVPEANTLKQAVDELAKHPMKPQIQVLIYQGTSKEAAAVAKAWPQFHIILCQADGDLPPMMPQKAGNTLIVHVGHRGQHVGVLAAYKKQDGFDFRYQLVPMEEFYITPGTEEEARKKNKVLPLLEEYAVGVKKDIRLGKDYPRTPHLAQINALGFKQPVQLTYVGSDACKACHKAEHDAWGKTLHSHAMEALEKKATRPTLRQYDGECVRCHSVGFEHTRGYEDEKLTPHLKHVGCESCHGPGSGHVAKPKDKSLLPLLSLWKNPAAKNPATEKLPDVAFMAKMAKLTEFERGKEKVPAEISRLITATWNMCGKCHDHENDPHFDLYKYWPKVRHTGLAPPGGWPAVVPKK